jgi:hypothetical protein
VLDLEDEAEGSGVVEGEKNDPGIRSSSRWWCSSTTGQDEHASTCPIRRSACPSSTCTNFNRTRRRGPFWVDSHRRTAPKQPIMGIRSLQYDHGVPAAAVCGTRDDPASSLSQSPPPAAACVWRRRSDTDKLPFCLSSLSVKPVGLFVRLWPWHMGCRFGCNRVWANRASPGQTRTTLLPCQRYTDKA